MENATIKWVCVYCNKPQETPNLAAFDIEGQKSYQEVIKEAAKNGGIACNACFHSLIFKY